MIALFVMKRLIRLLELFSTLDINQIAFGLYHDKDVQHLIIELNTQRQLFDRGEDAQGISLEDLGGPYSPLTIEGDEGPNGFKGKRELGLPFDRITLFHTGIFYASFRVIPEQDGFRIVADTIKDGVDLRDEWSENILGLQDESRKELARFLLPRIIRSVKETLLAA